MSFDQFVGQLESSYPHELDRAIGFAWYVIRNAEAGEASIDQIVACFEQADLSRPNKSRLKANLLKHPMTLRLDGGDAIRLHRSEIQRLDQEFREVAQAREKPLSVFSDSLRAHAQNLKNAQTQSFVLEAIECMDQAHYRAAIVLSWVGSVSVLYEHVVSHALPSFNADALTNGLIKRPIKTPGDLTKLKESDFLDVLERLSVLSNAVKKELKTCLERRNNCGHPNDFKIGEAQVAAHIESLIHHVFERF